MLSSAKNYPFFDLAEIKPELEFSNKRFETLKPVKTGNTVPFDLRRDFYRWQQFYNGAQTHGPLITRDLLNKPLVIAFYSQHWGQAGVDKLIILNALHNEVRANGGNLLIITPDKSDTLENVAWEHSLTLNFYFDADNVIAEKFRVYSDKSPTWNTFSGINVNVPLLATYVIDSARQVLYHHIDTDLDNRFLPGFVLSAVYSSALNNNTRRSA
jgi:peroxiredoxin